MCAPSELQSGMILRLKVVAYLSVAEYRVSHNGRFPMRFGGS
jgi:type II secretory ATPase GspE/PulE/Tfp pilus assembly ATPase PilB-like protein